MDEHSLRQNLSALKQWNIRQFHRWKKLGLAVALLVSLVAGISLIGGPHDPIQAAPEAAQAAGLSKTEKDLPHDFQFIGQGRIIGGSGQTWIVGGVPTRVDGHSQVVGDLHAGDFAILTGRILQNGTWLIDRISLAPEDGPHFTFNGRLEEMGARAWKIGGFSLAVNAQTKVDEGLKPGDIVLATFTALADGTWQAAEIRAFDATSFEPTATPSPSPTPTEKPQITATPAAAPVPSAYKQQNQDKENNGEREDRPKNKDKHKHKDHDEGDSED